MLDQMEKIIIGTKSTHRPTKSTQALAVHSADRKKIHTNMTISSAAAPQNKNTQLNKYHCPSKKALDVKFCPKNLPTYLKRAFKAPSKVISSNKTAETWLNFIEIPSKKRIESPLKNQDELKKVIIHSPYSVQQKQ